MDSNTLRRIPDKHGNLPRNTAAALDEVEGILTSSVTIKAAEPVTLRVQALDFALAREPTKIGESLFTEQIEWLTAGLGPTGALVIFPEGAN